MVRTLTERTRAASLLLALLNCTGCGDDDGAGGTADAGPDAAPVIDAASRVTDDAGPADAGRDAAEPLDAATSDAGSDRDAAPSADNDGGAPGAMTDAALDGPRERTMLVDHRYWTVLDEADDPFDDRPASITCDPLDTGYGIEELNSELAFFVDTQRCTYATAEQPSIIDVRAGELVKVRLWYFELTAPEGGEAHIVVQLGSESLIDRRIPIPSGSGGLLSARWTAPSDIPEGEPVRVHIHNHGANEYALIEVSTGPQE